MRESLIESIGRERALKLMSDAVRQAVDEKNNSRVFCEAKTTQVVDGSLRVIEDARQVPPVAAPSPASQLLRKQVPIA